MHGVMVARMSGERRKSPQLVLVSQELPCGEDNGPASVTFAVRLPLAYQALELEVRRQSRRLLDVDDELVKAPQALVDADQPVVGGQSLAPRHNGAIRRDQQNGGVGGAPGQSSLGVATGLVGGLGSTRRRAVHVARAGGRGWFHHLTLRSPRNTEASWQEQLLAEQTCGGGRDAPCEVRRRTVRKRGMFENTST